jgi:phosphoribosylformimino-5-aminoimidazole carboxamide ribonucleotide (ProFAR) isomerase
MVFGSPVADYPLPTSVPRAQSSFAFDDPEYVQEILRSAGFRDVRVSVDIANTRTLLVIWRCQRSKNNVGETLKNAPSALA